MAKRVSKGNLWGFCQSRPYTSIADIRRLFGVSVDDAACVCTSEGTYYIGLPSESADVVRQLWQEGRIVLDTIPDLHARVVQGVYPARAAFGRAGLAQPRRAGPGRAPAARGELEEPGLSQSPAPTPTGTPDTAIAPAAGAPGKRRRKRKRRAGRDSPVEASTGVARAKPAATSTPTAVP